MCLYNVVILSAVGLTLTLLLGDHDVMMYGVTSGCLIIGTTLTQMVVFVPKVLHFRLDNKRLGLISEKLINQLTQDKAEYARCVQIIHLGLKRSC